MIRPILTESSVLHENIHGFQTRTNDWVWLGVVRLAKAQHQRRTKHGAHNNGGVSQFTQHPSARDHYNVVRIGFWSSSNSCHVYELNTSKRLGVGWYQVSQGYSIKGYYM